MYPKHRHEQGRGPGRARTRSGLPALSTRLRFAVLVLVSTHPPTRGSGAFEEAVQLLAVHLTRRCVWHVGRGRRHQSVTNPAAQCLRDVPIV